VIDEPHPNYLKQSFWEKLNGDNKTKLTERQYITILVLLALTRRNLGNGDDVSSEFVDAFLRHTALISEISLSERLVEAVELNDEAQSSLQEFCEEASVVLSSEEWATNMDSWQCISDVSDLVDGRLLGACVQNKSIGRNQTYQTLAKAMASSGAGSVSDDKAIEQEQQGM
jgi:hypothetical protein